MQTFRFTIAKTGLFLLFLGLTLLQLLSFPGQFRHMRRTNGFSLLFEISLTLVVGLWLCCGQVALICLWRIVESMKLGRFYSAANFTWINRLLLTFKVASIIPIILFLMLIPQADDPGFFVLLSIVTLFIFSLTAISSLIKDEIEKKLDNSI